MTAVSQTRGRATNDVNATPGPKFRAGHQKHHSAVGHLDSRPAPHYKRVVTGPIVNSSSCSFPMSHGPAACTVQARVRHLEVVRSAPRNERSFIEMDPFAKESMFPARPDKMR